MDNISTIIITSAATLIATVLGGLVIEYLRRIKPKLIFKVTDAVPIKLENKNLGANVITISNPSSKTIKEVVVKIKTIADKVQDGGIKVSEGLEYELSSEGNSMSVSMPFLKPKDELSITAISEGTLIPTQPEVTIRSPEVFKLIHAEKIKEQKDYKQVVWFLRTGDRDL